ncbi:MAG: hypothetical protein ACXVKA_02055 [Acidimicrobiia bacterium]
MLIATALWWMTPELVLDIDRQLGTPVDSYVNGSQTWFTGEEQTLEWRLHPVGAFTMPRGLSHYDLWERVVDELSAGRSAEALELGEDTRPLGALWDGLECFPAYGDDLEPATLSGRATKLLGVAPGLCGLVDHDKVADAWEATKGEVSIVRLLGDQLRA